MMAKAIYAYLVLLLLTPPFVSASVSIDYRDYPGYCPALSGAFHGLCLDDDDCNDTCVLDDHHQFGVCRGLQCTCYNPC
ncbi:hypothetical protein SUGI_0024070 [Cryptomeria japonica]|nr:hypothetical protein SUGI_0024070 [Cryptomeria japonica]